MKRLATAAVTVPVTLAAVFYLPGPWFFLLALVVVEIAAGELARLARRALPDGPHRSLYVFVPLAALALVPGIWAAELSVTGSQLLWLALGAVAIGMGSLVLLSRVPVEQALAASGVLAFGTAYLALPVASLYDLQQRDPWVLFLLLAIVWLGDTAAYYIGTRFGRRRLAPRVSPNKTWEGSAASLGAALLVAALWSWWRMGSVSLTLIAIAAVTSAAAQLGDLVESMIKRGAEVKDSGSLFPGHGGMLDRIDALLFAAPVMCLCLYLFDLG